MNNKNKTPEKGTGSHWTVVVDLLILFLLLVLCYFSFFVELEASAVSMGQWLHLDVSISRSIIVMLATLVALVIFSLYTYRVYVSRKDMVTPQQYAREKKLKEINAMVLSSVSTSHAQKTRDILRYTYGNVAEWNPISYRGNVLMYDVHEQIRSILGSLKKTVIDIDPTRFHDKNVAVNLIYCYPDRKTPYEELPLLAAELSPEQAQLTQKWKLISSTDITTDPAELLQGLTEVGSFYTRVDHFGLTFVNSKGNAALSAAALAEVKQSLTDKCYGVEEADQNAQAILLKKISELNPSLILADSKDIQFKHNDKLTGSAIGLVINVRSDDPDKTFVKAILTIQTYGEEIHVPVSGKKGTDVDRYGLTSKDYQDLLFHTILGTYENMLASEMSQMYLRHCIRDGSICPYTGRQIKRSAKSSTLAVSQCQECDNMNCSKNKQRPKKKSTRQKAAAPAEE